MVFLFPFFMFVLFCWISFSSLYKRSMNETIDVCSKLLLFCVECDLMWDVRCDIWWSKTIHVKHSLNLIWLCLRLNGHFFFGCNYCTLWLHQLWIIKWIVTTKFNGKIIIWWLEHVLLEFLLFSYCLFFSSFVAFVGYVLQKNKCSANSLHA